MLALPTRPPPMAETISVRDEILISEGRVTLGQAIGHTHRAGDFRISPSLEVSGIWQFDRPNYLNDAGESASSGSDIIGRLEESVTIGRVGGFNLDASGHYESVGSSDDEA